MKSTISDTDSIWECLVACFSTEERLIARLESLYPSRTDGAQSSTPWRSHLSHRPGLNAAVAAFALELTEDLVTQEDHAGGDTRSLESLRILERSLRMRLSNEVTRAALQTVGRLLQEDGLGIDQWASGVAVKSKRTLERYRSVGCSEADYTICVEGARSAVTVAKSSYARPAQIIAPSERKTRVLRLGKLEELLEHLALPGMHFLAAVAGVSRDRSIALSVNDELFSLVWPANFARSYKQKWTSECQIYLNLLEARRPGASARGTVSVTEQEQTLVSACEAALGNNAWTAFQNALATDTAELVIWLQTTGRWQGLPLFAPANAGSQKGGARTAFVHMACRRSFHVYRAPPTGTPVRILITFSGLYATSVSGPQLQDRLGHLFKALRDVPAVVPDMRFAESLQSAESMAAEFQPQVLIVMRGMPVTGLRADRPFFDSVEDSVRRIREQCRSIACNVVIPLSTEANTLSRGADLAEAYFDQTTPSEVIGCFLACLAGVLAAGEVPGEALVRATRAAVRHPQQTSALQPVQLWCAFEDFQVPTISLPHWQSLPDLNEPRLTGAILPEPDSARPTRQSPLQQIWERLDRNTELDDILTMLQEWCTQVLKPWTALDDLSIQILQLLRTHNKPISRSLVEQRLHADTAELQRSLDTLAKSGFIVQAAEKISLASNTPVE